MAKSARTFNASCIAMNPSFFLHLISVSPFSTPKKTSRNRHQPSLPLIFFLSLWSLSALLGICSLAFYTLSHSPIACSSSSPLLFASLSSLFHDSSVPLPPQGPPPNNPNISAAEKDFWSQPDSEGYRPCLRFSLDYRRSSAKISKERRRFLVVVVSGGLNQQRNQIVDAVVIARILEAALVVPVLQVNRIWGDESEFSDIFDLEHFKKTLQSDVRVVSSLPSTHLVPKQSVENQMPFHVSPLWIRARFLHQLNEDGFLILKALDSRLSKNLPPDLQKLRCKVAFHALRFASRVQQVGNQIARRMWIEGPYIAVHLRIEKDVWVRTGCVTGLGDPYDAIIANERRSNPDFLTDRLNMTRPARRLAGLCPLSALEVARFVKALGAPSSARVYIAGGEPFGGRRALQALVDEFPNVATKETLARDGELEPYVNRSSILAAIDYIVSLSSDVFVPSHGGNMGRAMQGHRAYVGHRKYIRPNKRAMIPLLEDGSVSEEEMCRIVRKVHKYSMGQPELRSRKVDRDVLAYPVPECMCKQ
ncbi:hypothetical protein SASPL_137328 [Salvia splendens]|uniref:O-fucosyltransferase family protein n=1 Tax=Salvia splendens TaxID=180675 RepID=A0A8X8WT75_SALSN|nr:O-fucosyltransferase 37 [Salvia splendens]KAG6400491.1 hypothetical protein SASPL_137328 [Salvia splendens]